MTNQTCTSDVCGLALCLFLAGAFAWTPAQAAEDTTAQAEELSWLRDGDYARLETHFSELQARYDRREIGENALYLGFRTLDSADSDLQAHYDNWVQHYPRSYAARLARGNFYYHRAESLRGEQAKSEPSTDDLKRWREGLDLAQRDLEVSLKLAERPYLSTWHSLMVARHERDTKQHRYWLDEGTRIDPQALGVRVEYMRTLSPRAGGSYPAMRAYLDECRKRRLSAAHLGILEAMLHAEYAAAAAERHQFSEAMAKYRRALEVHPRHVPAEVVDVGLRRAYLEAYVYAARLIGRGEDIRESVTELAQAGTRDGSVYALMAWFHDRDQKFDLAWPYYVKAARLNDAYAQRVVGYVLYHGRHGIVPDPDEGLAMLQRAAEQGNKTAKRDLESIQAGPQ